MSCRLRRKCRERRARRAPSKSSTRALASSRSMSRSRMELDAIVELGETESTQNLIRNFFLAEKYRKGSSKAPAEKITHAAVIGAGVMGSGIAQWLSSRGVSVILRDVDARALDRGLANIEKTYGEAVKRGLMSEEKAKEGRARIVASTASGRTARRADRDRSRLGKARNQEDNLSRSRRRKSDDSDILATNTSALPIGELAANTETSGARHRTAFFQSGQPNEADRSRGRQTDLRRDDGARARFRPADRQVAGGRAETAPAFSLTAFFSLSARRSRAFRAGRRCRRNRRRAGASGGCRWARCV